MSAWSAFYRRVAAPAQPAPVLPTVDVTAELQDVARSALADMTNRKRAAIRLIDDKLNQERARGPLRDATRMNDLLDVRNVLDPGSRILPVRASVPVVPGRAS